MRILNKRQKKAIDKWFSENWRGTGSIIDGDNMDPNLYDIIERINPHETFWSNLNRYICDKVLEKLYG